MIVTMRLAFLLFINAFAAVGVAQMTLSVSVPQYYTPMLETLHVAGDFNDWNPASLDHVLVPQSDGTFLFVLDGWTDGAPFEFKFTRGDWARVEGTATGEFLANRSAVFVNGGVLDLSIAGWEDFPGTPTASGDLRVLSTVLPIPQLNRTRRVWVHLPADYTTSTNFYPVVYMLDGQNVFDAATSFAGEWGVDESMESLPNGVVDAIVVAIDNGGAERINEYSAWENPQYGGGDAAAFADFLVNDLKPLIDGLFRTQPGRTTTAVMGSSLGGLMAMYLVLEHGETFGKAGVMSPSFWFTNGIYTLAESHTVLPDTRIFMLGGTNESTTMVSNMEAMEAILVERGYTEQNLRLEAHSYGQHNENYWAGEYTPTYTWLFEGVATAVPALESKSPKAWPNPTNDTLTVELNHSNAVAVFWVYDLNGRMVIEKRIQIAENQLQISVHDVPVGMYNGILEVEGAHYRVPFFRAP